MSLLLKHFDSSRSYASPVVDDFDRCVEYDENGNELISYKKVDYPSIVRSHGVVDDWSLNNLLKAGVDPNFNIHTSYPTRAEGLDMMNSAIDSINSTLDFQSTDTSKTE